MWPLLISLLKEVQVNSISERLHSHLLGENLQLTFAEKKLMPATVSTAAQDRSKCELPKGTGSGWSKSYRKQEELLGPQASAW